MTDQTPAGAQEAAALLARLSDEFFEIAHTTDPLNATQLGVSGFDALVPDPSREGSARGARRLAAIETGLDAIDPGLLGEQDRVNHAVLAWLAWGARSDLEHGLWEGNASAGAYVSPQAMVFQSVPAALLDDAGAADAYLQRLRGLAGYFDAVTRRYREASRDGRVPTQVGVRQAVEQLEGHLGKDITADTLVSVSLPDRLDRAAIRREAAGIVEAEIRPAMRRLLACLQQDLLPVARGNDKVGIRFIPGGAEGYRAAVRRHTTTEFSPEQSTRWASTASRSWRPSGRNSAGAPCRPATSRRSAAGCGRTGRSASPVPPQIVRTVADALRRAEEVRDDWFPSFEIPDCIIEEIDPVEAGNAPLAYYRPPAGGGLRPGAHCVLTSEPERRFVYEYEALAFHESTPGHHLQIASAQTLRGLPAYRRFLDAEVCGYVEGWGLYCERLADEMGLYTSDLQRLGMLSFDALRACRLVVDTGMHHLRMVPLAGGGLHVAAHRNHPGQRPQRNRSLHSLARPGARLHGGPPRDPPSQRGGRAPARRALRHPFLPSGGAGQRRRPAGSARPARDALGRRDRREPAVRARDS